MQLSVKTPRDLSLPFLEKLAEIKHPIPSAYAADCVFHCIQAMKTPYRDFNPLPIVADYYFLTGREHKLRPESKDTHPALRELEAKSRAQRAKESSERLRKFREQTTKSTSPPHVHLKISGDLPEEIKEKAAWLGLRSNAFVVKCLRDCLAAMDDPLKAIVPLPIIVEFWTISKAHLRAAPASSIDAMVFHTQERMVRERKIQIMDTVVRYVINGEWQTPLQTILRDAGLPVDGDTKSS
jgi:hypothetical protein